MTEAYLHSATGAYRYVKFFIAPSSFLATKVVEFGLDPRRVVHVPNFVDAESIPTAEAEGRYFLFAGRLERVKGVRTLLEAVRGSEIARACELRIAGDGEDRQWLEAYCRENGLERVRFLGHLSQEAMGPLLDGAAFAVVPSEWYENLPLSVMEAAARGKAVIVSDLGGLPELVRQGETGLICRAGDPQALQAALEDLLGNPGRAREMGRRGRALMQECYSPQIHYDGLMAVYERALLGEAVLTREMAAP
jgi:glycosyltransferase involved in cell wall biosynthesis